MVLRGKAHKFGDDINTDDIIAAKYLNTTNASELGKYCMETIASNFVQKVSKDDIIVAGKNFGCGSSREHAPIAIKGCGIACVVAQSFARIFYRNAINIGLPIIELKESSQIKEGSVLEIDLVKGIIRSESGDNFKIEPFPAFLQGIIEKDGLLNWIKTK